jgi:2-haloacid dehalogenase
MATRWATFDCYGTLIDWDGGLRTTLAALFGDGSADELLTRYHEIEPRVQAERYLPYREVLDRVTAMLADERERPLTADERTAMSESLASWPAFADVPAALAELCDRGWSLAILSNCDRDLIATSVPKLEIGFDDVIVAEDTGSYKPDHGHWRRFRERHPDAEPHVHVGASLFHDVAPAHELGLPAVWINRRGEPATVAPDAELPTLAGLAGVLDRLVRR